MNDTYYREMSELLIDFLASYKIGISVVGCERINEIINFYVKPIGKTKVKTIVNSRQDISLNFANCLSVVPLFDEGVIRISIEIPDDFSNSEDLDG